MKTVTEFDNVVDARSYTANKEKMLHKDRLVQFLTKHRCVTSLRESNDELAQGLFLAVTSGVDEYNVMESHPVGVENLSLLGYLVSIEAVNQAFYDECYAYANEAYQPYANLTDHAFNIAKGTVTLKPVTVDATGWAVITVTDECELHNPRLMAKSPRTGKTVRIGSFMSVTAEGSYELKVPVEWRNAELYVDDVFGVLA